MAAMNSALDLETVLQTALQIAQDLTGARACRLYLPNKQENELVLQASRGSTADQDRRSNSLPVTGSLAGQAFSTGQLVILDERSATHAAEIMACAPLPAKPHCCGVMTLSFPPGHRFDDDDKALLTAIGHQVGITVQNARTMEEAHRRARQQHALLTILPDISSHLHLETLLQRITEQAVKVIPDAQRGSMLMLRDGAFHFMGAVGYDLEKLSKVSLLPEQLAPGDHPRYQVVCIRDINRWSMARLQPETFQNLRASAGHHNIKVTLSAPIVVGDQVFGYLSLDNFDSYDAFDPLSREMVELFAAQAAVAITNAGLHGALEQKVEQRTREVRRQQDRTRAILQSVADGVIVTDRQAKIVLTNPVAESWLYYGQGDGRITNQPLLSFVQRQAGQTTATGPQIIEFPNWEQPLDTPCWQATACAFQDCPAHGRQDTPCWHIAGAHCLLINASIEKNGHQRELTCPIRDKLSMVSLEAQASWWQDGDTVLGKALVLRDVSRQRQLERIQRQFVATVSHELRTPLTNIKLYHNLLKRGPAEKREQFMAVMGREINRLEQLIQEILDLSRLEKLDKPPHQEAVDLNALLQELVEAQTPQAENKRLTLHLETTLQALEILANRNQILQVITNLLTNAINYTPAGGHIWLSSGIWQWQGAGWLIQGNIARPEDTVSPPASGGGWAVVNVQDSGPGIPYEDQPRIFDRFYRGVQANQGVPGTGLGLAIVREILELHDGHILLESTPGVGSRFTVLLPLPAQEQPIRVLVADDEEQIGQLIQRYLDREGIETRWVGNGQAALDAIAAKPPDLLILDLAMPVMDGYRVMELLQAQASPSSPPVLVLSSWTEDKFQRAKQLGATDFLNKPFSGAVLVDVVKRLTTQARSDRRKSASRSQRAN